MSFTDLKVAELRKIAEEYAVDLNGATTKAKIIAKLEDDGVSYGDYAKLSDAPRPEVIPDEDEPITGPTVIVKMVRQNPSYETHGVRFTKEHPFAIVSEETADKILDGVEGFTLASPRETKEYYS
jgi:hypothetical protein